MHDIKVKQKVYGLGEEKDFCAPGEKEAIGEKEEEE